MQTAGSVACRGNACLVCISCCPLSSGRRYSVPAVERDDGGGSSGGQGGGGGGHGRAGAAGGQPRRLIREQKPLGRSSQG